MVTPPPVSARLAEPQTPRSSLNAVHHTWPHTAKYPLLTTVKTGVQEHTHSVYTAPKQPSPHLQRLNLLNALSPAAAPLLKLRFGLYEPVRDGEVLLAC